MSQRALVDLSWMFGGECESAVTGMAGIDYELLAEGMPMHCVIQAEPDEHRLRAVCRERRILHALEQLTRKTRLVLALAFGPPRGTAWRTLETFLGEGAAVAALCASLPADLRRDPWRACRRLAGDTELRDAVREEIRLMVKDAVIRYVHAFRGTEPEPRELDS